MPPVASAADAANVNPSSSAEMLQEIVVTSTRQGEQSLQDTPMALFVVSPAELDQKGLSGISELVRTLPSVNMQSQSPGVNDIEMRGLVTKGLDATTLQDRSLTAVYLDEAPISLQTANPDLRVYDLERIEVLPGPQGTLYGAGSMAGTIRLITRKPDAREFFGSGDASVSSTTYGGTNYSVRGVVNMPLKADTLAVRVAGYRGDDSGFIDNIGTGRRDANDSESTQGRIALRWTGIQNLTLDASATIARLTSHGLYSTYPQLGRLTYTSLQPERDDDDFKLYNLTADADLSFAHLVTSVSYLDRVWLDYPSLDFFDENVATPGIRLPANITNLSDIKDATEEVRLVSRQDSRLRWVAGAFHEQFHRFFPQEVYSPGFDATIAQLYGPPDFNSQTVYNTPRPNDFFYGWIDVRERQTALFSEVTYSLASRLDLTAGARYFDFHQEFSLLEQGFGGSLAPGEDLRSADSQTSRGVNPRAVLSSKLTDSLLVFAQASRGFRYGGVNLPVPLSFCASYLQAAGLTSAPATFAPDHLWDYEIGEKSTLADDRVSLDTTAFYIDWSNVQTTHPLACGYPFIVSGGKVKSQGLELTGRARVTSSLTVNLSGSFTDATANGSLPNLGAQDGERVPYFPKTILIVGGDYTVPVLRGRTRLSVDYTYRSRAFTEFNPQDPLYREIPSSTMLNASLGYSLGAWEVALFGTNLTNNALISSVIAPGNNSFIPGDKVYVGRPRTIGARVHVDF